MKRLSPRGPEALLCAQACYLSYEDFESDGFDRLVRRRGFSNILTINKAGVEAFCVENDKYLIVCFRGTDSGADWLMDAMTSKTPLVAAAIHKVHTGFLRSMMIVEQEVRAFVDVNLRDGHQLLITGHSLGAAMAVLFASRHICDRIDGVITFGSPRVGNEAFCTWFNQQFMGKVLRFVNNNDAVTRVPWKCMGYSHVWRQQYFDRAGNFRDDYHPSRGWKLWDGFAGRLRNLARLKIGDGITDHSMNDYLRLARRLQG